MYRRRLLLPVSKGWLLSESRLSLTFLLPSLHLSRPVLPHLSTNLQHRHRKSRPTCHLLFRLLSAGMGAGPTPMDPGRHDAPLPSRLPSQIRLAQDYQLHLALRCGKPCELMLRQRRTALTRTATAGLRRDLQVGGQHIRTTTQGIRRSRRPRSQLCIEFARPDLCLHLRAE